MEQCENADHAKEKAVCSLSPGECAALQERLRHAEQEVGRLQNCLELKIREVSKLTRAIVNSSMVHCDVETRLQRELAALCTGTVDRATPTSHPSTRTDSPGDLVTVKLPYTTTILSVLFESMFAFWTDCDPRRLPKSSTVAHAIDERLGFSAQVNGEASRSAQAYASAIRPDWVKDADRRHHRPGPRT
jgi:hypothetical protein